MAGVDQRSRGMRVGCTSPKAAGEAFFEVLLLAAPRAGW